MRQPEPLGLGHAVWCARELIGNEPFAVLLCDDVILSDTPCLAQMTAAYDELGGNVVAVVDVPREHTNRYGILDVESDDGKIAKIKGMVEKPKPEDAPSTLSVIGRYILQPEVFVELGAARKGAGGEIQLTDGMAALIGKQPFHGLRFEGKRYDCGDKVGFIEANVAFALKRKDIGEKVRAAITALLPFKEDHDSSRISPQHLARIRCARRCRQNIAYCNDAHGFGPQLRHHRQAPGRQQNIAVGYDGRTSSPEMAAHVIEGIRSTGIDVICRRPGADADAVLFGKGIAHIGRRDDHRIAQPIGI